MIENIKIITIDEFTKQSDLCFVMPNDETKLNDDIGDYIEATDDCVDWKNPYEDVKNQIEKAKAVEIYRKKYFNISYSRLKDLLYEEMENEFDLDDYEMQGLDIVKKFVKDFNEVQNFYTLGDSVGILDVSERVEENLTDLESE